MLPNESECSGYPTRTESIVACQLNRGIQPELRLPAGMLNVYVGSPFLARKEIEPVAADAQDGWTHAER